jgi:hypothetical protein
MLGCALSIEKYGTKNMYILILLLILVTTGTKTSVILGNKIVYVCVKDVCCL